MSEREKKYRRSPQMNRVVGNNALAYDYALPLREPDIMPEEIPAVRPKVKKSQEEIYRAEPRFDANYAKINRLCTFVLAFVIIATLGVLVLFLKTQLSYGELNEEIESVKRELNTMKRANVELEEEIKGMIDLEYIYDVAVNEFGMRLPGPNEVYYIKKEPVSYTTKYGAVEVPEPVTGIGGVLGYITRGW